MKILCLPDGIPIDYTIQLANALAKSEEVMIATFAKPKLEHMDDISKNVELHITQLIRRPLWHPNNLIRVIGTIRKFVKYDPDIIHAQSTNPLTILIYMFQRKSTLITTFHDVKPHLGLEKKIMLRFVRFWLMKKSQQIFVHGECLKKIMIAEYNIPENKIKVIPIGEHNVSPFKKYTKMNVKEEKSVLFFGWIEIRKGLEYLIRAEPIISKEVPGTKIIIAGKSSEMNLSKGYFEKCQHLMINKNNFEIYNSHISWKFGAELFQKSSIVILPYIEVSQSGVIPTAYGFKKPVVVTRVGAMPEIVDDGITGLIVPPKDPDALARAIIQLLKDDRLRKDMGENAYNKLKTDLSWDGIAETTIKTYKEAMGVSHANYKSISNE